MNRAFSLPKAEDCHEIFTVSFLLLLVIHSLTQHLRWRVHTMDELLGNFLRSFVFLVFFAFALGFGAALTVTAG